jgi:hypothetical protein
LHRLLSEAAAPFWAWVTTQTRTTNGLIRSPGTADTQILISIWSWTWMLNLGAVVMASSFYLVNLQHRE